MIFFVYVAALVDFANLVTKKVSLLVCGHVVQVRHKKANTDKQGYQVRKAVS